MTCRTLFDKLWDEHLVHEDGDGNCLLYVDRHYIHEVTSAQAYESLRLSARTPWRPMSIVATADHNTPTTGWEFGLQGIADVTSRLQVQTLDANVRQHGAMAYFPFRDPGQGIVHVIGPETGATLPGMTVVCGDSHTPTHGALGALAIGIGTSEVEHVLATQTLRVLRPRQMRVNFEGSLLPCVGAKDLALALIGRIGTAAGAGHVIEFAGGAVDAMSIEGRMTLCNMSIEAGSRSAVIGVDDATLAYVSGRRWTPTGPSSDQAMRYWKTLHTDAGASFDCEVHFDVDRVEPQVTWGTSPEMVTSVTGSVPEAPLRGGEVAWRRALNYMGLKPGDPIHKIRIDRVFIGSCTNSRIEDLRDAARVLRSSGARISSFVRQALVVPGSGAVRRQAEVEGLDDVFRAAGFEWRQPGCSMCLGMNGDSILPGEHCASTSNRNFEGRQGSGGRTHLMSPATAAATALAGFIADPRQWF
jgi:3-isopropylmalate/(R)-2-methylmalate dehydratase large subunit